MESLSARPRRITARAVAHCSCLARAVGAGLGAAVLLTGPAALAQEIRVDGEQWFLDTFIKSGENQRALYAENFKHALGQWYHVALVFDGATMKHYVDGKEELSGPLTIAPLDKGKTSLGVRMNRVYWFKGAISRVRFTPRALSPREFMEKK